jgi:porin
VAPLSPSTRLCQVALLGLAVALACQPLAAAENSGANSPAALTEEKSGAAPTEEKSGDKLDAKSANRPENKKADQSGDKSKGKDNDKSGKEDDNKSESPPEAKEKTKPPDPCDPEKQLVNFDLRDRLCKSGVKLSITETSEILGNLTGGMRQGLIYEGLTDLNLGIDLRPTLHWRGNIFARAYQIHGRGLTANNLDNLDFASSIEAERTTRLSELWYEQHFDYWRLRIGQQSIGTEFFNPESARLFVNGTFGWPTQPSIDLPSGGPGFPLGTPAVRLRVDPEEGWTYFLGLFNGDPTGAGVGGSQLRDASGTAFRTSDGAWVLSELRYNPGDSDKNGTYRFGGWWNSGRFRDLHIDQNDISLASPASNGKPFRHDGDYSFYVNIDQPLIVNEADHTSLAVFARAGIAPSDRNLNDIYVDAGILYKGPFGRADDQTGIGVAYAHIGSAARAFDADVQRFTGQFHPIRSGEAVLELTYRFQLTDWWQLQPDFQYIFNPGGGIANPITPNQRVGDAAVIGLRTAISF